MWQVPVFIAGDIKLPKEAIVISESFCLKIEKIFIIILFKKIIEISKLVKAMSQI